MEADKAAKRSAREAALKDFNLVAEFVGVEPANLRWLGRILLCIGRRINNGGGGERWRWWLGKTLAWVGQVGAQPGPYNTNKLEG